MGSLVLTQLQNAWQVDQAIFTEASKLVAIRFGHASDPGCMRTDEQLSKVQILAGNFAVVYSVDIGVVKDFNEMYELYDSWCIMFFWRNKHMMLDCGTGNNNKINFDVPNKMELYDLFESVYRHAKKGRGLAPSPKDYSTRLQY